MAGALGRGAACWRMRSAAGGRKEKPPGSKPQPRHENMKKPWSPDLPVDNQSYNSDFTSLPDREGEKELAADGTEEKKEREKKHTNFTLCNVCNIQLNSAAQAQIHYNGKSHQKRLKQLSNGNLKSDNGGTCQSPALPALVRPPAPPLQPSLDIKPFLPFPLDTAAAVNLFPNFNAMDPIQKAVINHTFGVPLPHRRKQIISCNICQLRFNSDLCLRKNHITLNKTQYGAEREIKYFSVTYQSETPPFKEDIPFVCLQKGPNKRQDEYISKVT